jgi:hypothetical protein
MRFRLTPLRVRLALLATLGCLPVLALVPGKGPPVAHAGSAEPGKALTPTEQAWSSYEEAIAQLQLYPRDPYLQYVAMQLARRESRTAAAGQRLEQLTFQDEWDGQANRRERVDLFSIFTGALAVQESLQLDSMRRAVRRGAPEWPPRDIIDVVNLQGPTIKSHPWQKMLGDRKPDISPLARMVPEDFWFAEFRSLNKMLELLDAGDLWSMHLFDQASRDARTQQTGERLRQQLVLRTNRLLRPLYDTVVEEVAVTGSDLFVAEGSDVTLLFRARQADVLKARMDGFLADVLKARSDARRSEGSYLGVDYVHVTTPERDVHVFSAYPEAGLHVRSNSKAGLQRVLEAIKGKTPDGKAVRRMGDATEFAYIRTLMPRGAKEEDGFIYLSDPFIRHLVGPKLKLTERRRMLCYNHLRMIGHASLMYRTEFGQAAKSLDDLAVSNCCPGMFNEGDLVCPDGGKYVLSADGLHGVCSHHGHAHQLVPCVETPLAWVTREEADEYRAFLREYNNYWRTFFDPIAIRVQVTPERYRMETIVLPLINNSIYQGLASVLKGEPEQLEALPVPKRNIFSAVARIDKEAVLKSAGTGNDLGPFELDRDFLLKGLGNQLGIHIYDSVPLFDLDLPRFLQFAFRDLNGQNWRNPDMVASFVVMSINSPVYISVPVQDAKIVDAYLERLDRKLTGHVRTTPTGGWFSFKEGFYKAKLKGGTMMRSYTFNLGPAKWRFHWARVGNGFYVASKPAVLEDIEAMEKARAEGKEAPKADAEKAHGLVRLRARNWNEVLADYRLGWEENNRLACLRNLGPLSSAARAVRAQNAVKPEALGPAAQRLADQMYAVHFFCPDGGRYVVSANGKRCSCSIHGNAEDQKQLIAPAGGTGPARALQDFGGLSARLTFLEDGLHAVVTLERQK